MRIKRLTWLSGLLFPLTLVSLPSNSQAGCSCHYGNVPIDHRVEAYNPIELVGRVTATVVKKSVPHEKKAHLTKEGETDLGSYDASDLVSVVFEFKAKDPDSDVCEPGNGEVSAKLVGKSGEEPKVIVKQVISGQEVEIGSKTFVQADGTWTATWPSAGQGGVYVFEFSGKVEDLCQDHPDSNDPEDLDMSGYKSRLTVLKVESVTAGKTEIAAGALDSSPHQTDITVQLSAAVSHPVAVWLVGGKGHGVGTETYSGYVLKVEGPAKIQGGGQTFTAGGSSPSTAAIVITTGSDGKALLVLTSSNELDENCTIHAKCGSDTSMAGSQGSCSVVFKEGEQTILLPDYLFANTVITSVVTRTFGGDPLPGHDTVVYVKSVKVGGTTLQFDWANPTALNVYAEIVSGDERQATNSDGQVKARVMIKDVSDMEEIEVATRDFQEFQP